MVYEVAADEPGAAGHKKRFHQCLAASDLNTLIKNHLAGGASRLAALLLRQILPVFSVVAPCHPGAALRDLVLVQRVQTTEGFFLPVVR